MKFPESAAHLKEAGFENVELTIDRANTSARRKEALKNVETQKGMDRDEMPPAVFQEGSQSVRLISSSDNRGAGASIGNQIRNLPDGAKVQIEVK